MKRVQVNLEYIFSASPAIIYAFLTTPDNLIRWFCDEADITGDIFTFIWSGSEEVAELIDDIQEQRLRFKWLDAEDEEEYLEFRMSRSQVTGTSILEITDYCDKNDVEACTALWNSQIKDLQMATGAA